MRVLLAHRDLWEGAVMDRLGVSEGGHWLQPSSLIKLRDIAGNARNADTLHLLCPSRAAADRLVELLPMDKFACTPSITDDQKVVNGAPGSGRETRVTLRFWWD